MTTAVDAVFKKTGLSLSVPISKVNEDLREVWGIATTPSLDIQGEIVDYEASKQAFQEWTDGFARVTGGESLGNVRSMHQPNPVGKVIAWKADDAAQRIWVGVKISKSPQGDAAWTQVKERVLNGFSIGAPSAERRVEYVNGKPRTRITSYKLSELSLVDNPACQDAWITEIKLAKGVGVMGPIEPMPLDAAPSGADWNQKNEITPNAFVDSSGAVWKKVDGAVVRTNERATMEKSGGTVITAHTRPESGPPGPKTPEVGSDPEKGKDHSPKKADGGQGIETPSAVIGSGSPHDAASKPIAPPETQGKAADAMMPPGQGPAPVSPAPAFPPTGGHKYCSYCAGKLADGSMPYHQECAGGAHAAPPTAAPPMGAPASPHPLTPAAPPTPSPAPSPVPSPFQREAMSDFFAGIQKAQTDGAALMKAALEGGFQKMNDAISSVAARVEKIEKTPIPGGPARTELPSGVSAVEKGGQSEALSKISDTEAALAKVIAATADPNLRDALSREQARLGIMKAQGGHLA